MGVRCFRCRNVPPRSDDGTGPTGLRWGASILLIDGDRHEMIANAAVRAALTSGDWPTLHDLADAQDAHGRTVLVNEVADADGVETFLRNTHAGQPDDALAATMLGAHLIRAGWRIRTAKRAQDVSREHFAQFFDHLRQAEQALIEATARHPEDAAAWTQRIISALGLELGQAEARRRYDRLAAGHPHHLPAQRCLLQQYCPKWRGTWDKTYAFARECAAAAPAGAPNAVLVVEAHLEQALDHGNLDTNGEFLRAQRERAEIHDRYADCAEMLAWPDGARQLIGHDATVLHIEPTLFDTHPAAMSVIDSAVPTDRQITMPPRDPEDVPQPRARHEARAQLARPQRAGWEILLMVLSGLATLVVGGFTLLLTVGMFVSPTAEQDTAVLWGAVVIGWLLAVILALLIVLLARRRREAASDPAVRRTARQVGRCVGR
ncbi:hypothetical protein HCA58_11555 [Micromonospora sp. HNM0581]|uniref:hypothetical protein n=1 Tax=Micromonospora sp. HNM0581 TaxID=2716341 RepID=UPI00146D9DB7|nr:hypothetical protein [Micromonospora sp. HNM0581]NLU78999.1 hypothetical protein [Micromonospora sp. HNM0581]